MITIRCPSCEKDYTFDESKIPADVEMLECKVCGAQFFLAQDDEDDAIVELTEEMQTEKEAVPERLDCPEDEPAWTIDEPAELLDYDEIDEDEPIVELTEEIPPARNVAPSQPAFSADRFKYLNTTRRTSTGKRILYILLILLSLVFLYYLMNA